MSGHLFFITISFHAADYNIKRLSLKAGVVGVADGAGMMWNAFLKGHRVTKPKQGR
jgi:hypothetical protein